MTAMTLERAEDEDVAPASQVTVSNKAAVDWVNMILDQKQWSRGQLANRSGVVASTISRLTSGKYDFMPSIRTLKKIAAASGYEIPATVLQAYGVSGTLDPNGPKPMDPATMRARQLREAKAVRAQEVLIEQSEAKSQPTLALRHISSLPSSLQPGLRNRIDVECPPQLVGDTTAFAFHMPDNSLEPVVKGGKLLYATKRRDPANGDVVLLTTDEGRSRVRIVKDISSEGFVVVKGNAPFDAEDEMVPFDEIGEVSIVAGFWLL